MNLDDFNVEEFGFDGIYDKNDVDLSEYEPMTINEKDVGEKITGKCSCMRLEPKGENNYTSIGLRVIDEENMEVLDCYANVPLDYPILKQNIRRSNGFLRTAFDFIMSTMECINEKSVIAPNGERKNVIKSGLNLEKIVDLYNELDEVTVEIIDGDEFYNSFKVIDMK